MQTPKSAGCWVRKPWDKLLTCQGLWIDRLDALETYPTFLPDWRLFHGFGTLDAYPTCTWPLQLECMA